MNLIYLAKPTYGGWVSFTTHLANLTDSKLYRVAKTTEMSKGKPKYRPYGYGLEYRNISLLDFQTLVKTSSEPYLITAVDSNYYKILPELPENGYLVIHDPTEIKSKKGELVQYLSRFKIITIRKSVSDYLTQKGITNTLLLHPYVSPTSLPDRISRSAKRGCVAISRIDYDKHTEIILRANQLLLEPIQIYGSKNDRYVYHHLKTLDPMKEHVPGSNYRGRFPKDDESLAKILVPAKFVVDLSRIKDDGGGSQYTFLEAINYGCILILHRDWVSADQSVFQEGVNCLAVATEDELANLLNSGINQTTLNKLHDNSMDILERHLGETGWFLS